MNLTAEEMFGAERLAVLGRRAQQAAVAREDTFAIPEAAPVAEVAAAMVPLGPLRIESERWLQAGASYHALIRLAARAVTNRRGHEAEGPAIYVPKARGEVEPLLALW